ncbi:MAG: aldolase/citrate lyase family protein [Acidobacteriota bacterium]|nr:aldolase/citrate lyase family protein [Acidobacteriota bacterium]
MSTLRRVVAAGAIVCLVHVPAIAQERHAVLDLWTAGTPAFGVFVPNENPQRFERGQPPPKGIYTREGAETLAASPLYDFLFLNLEGSYDAVAVRTLAEGLRSGAKGPGPRKTLIVRIPPIERDGVEATRARVKEVLAAGADGVTLPHIRSVDEAKTAIGFFEEAKANVWSPSNPSGTIIAMLMVEDPDAVAASSQIADLKGFSVLACGIGSLTQALKGDRAGAEAGTQKVLAESKRTKLPNMLTANPKDVAQRVQEGFLGLLGNGPAGDEMITIGRKIAGR